ncbi:shikimate kinase [Pseudobutyrivibrio xylanivorans]|uniref:Shikimate kinase n=1 Tax=Pseudobutyrivibrio xylanivorans TaxID=185007 RepID=A0A1G5RVS0_PSEXY|nr:shikimate kinase [Pseudobutyrivibrio xylanivorans]SCZ78017.1 shikimate kinase [Pseudobutyrivibrio xylanivorans]
MSNIFLIGFMGTGKSTIAEALKRKYDMQIVDMDAEIEKEQQMAISDIFATKGEEYFRDLETQLIKDLQKKDNVVVSCGGGAVLREENVTEMRKSGKVVLLNATPETILQRVKNSHNRPLLEGNKNVDFIRELMSKREDKYNRAADVTVSVDNRAVGEIADEVYSEVFK